MVVRDSDTGIMLETDNPIVIEQFKKFPGKYQEIKAEPPKAAAPKAKAPKEKTSN